MGQLTITTYRGRSIDPFDMASVDVEVADIAHALSMQSRFNGHCSRFYSVAEHCVLVSHIVPDAFALEALLHDAAEAYIGDIPGPIKARLPDVQRLEARVHAVIAERFGVERVVSRAVRDADCRALALEKSCLLGEGAGPLGPEIRAFAPAAARRVFLARFRELATTASDTEEIAQ